MLTQLNFLKYSKTEYMGGVPYKNVFMRFLFS